jgi:hypothetical protein
MLFVWDGPSIVVDWTEQCVSVGRMYMLNTELHYIRNEATQGVQFSFDVVHCVVELFVSDEFREEGRDGYFQ